MHQLVARYNTARIINGKLKELPELSFKPSKSSKEAAKIEEQLQDIAFSAVIPYIQFT